MMWHRRHLRADVISPASGNEASGPPAAYYPPADGLSPSAGERISEVSGALTPRTAEMSAEIYRLIVREIPQLRSDRRVLTLLEARVGEDVPTMLPGPP